MHKPSKIKRWDVLRTQRYHEETTFQGRRPTSVVEPLTIGLLKKCQKENGNVSEYIEGECVWTDDDESVENAQQDVWSISSNSSSIAVHVTSA